jgi:hypothetical protein
MLPNPGTATESISSGRSRVNIAGRTFTLRKKFLDDLRKIDPEAVIQT